MAQPRSADKAHWPKGLYATRPGYFIYRSPLNGKTTTIGRLSLNDAIAICKQLNETAEEVGISKRVRKLQNSHVEIDRRGLLEACHIASYAMNYEHLVGVYFLLLDGEIVYVGRSVNVLGRLATHRTNATITFNRVFVERCREEQLGHLEALYINKFRPKHNAAVPPVSSAAAAWDGSLSGMFGAAIHTRHA